ncbi:uncharacterized protein LOC144807903 [Lissotriton helveticus]
MAQDAAGASSSGRKRKIKFSEQELEHLIEGVTKDHNRLFDSNSRKVQEADKRRIWLRIRAKVNAVGVTQRSVDELKKRWYDLRGRAKEKIAERLGEQLATGGREPTVPPNTPLEDQVEETINPQACVGMTQLDSSRPTQDTPGGADVPSTDSEALVIEENTEDTEGDTHHTPQPGPSGQAATIPVIPPPASVARATPMTTGAAVAARSTQPPVGPATPAAGRQQTRRPAAVRSQTSGLVREPRTNTSRAGRGRIVRAGGLSIERRMLSVHQTQARHLAAIHLQLDKTARNVAHMTAAVEANTQAMSRQRNVNRHRHRQLLTRLSAYMRSNHIIGNATSQL